MPTSGQDLLGFIRERVRSVWALEMLLVMRSAEPRAWSAANLTAELRASVSLVQANLILLERAGLLARDEGDLYRYAPSTARLRQLCDQLESAYRERPVWVVNVIAAPSDRLRALADAFRFKGGDT